MVAAKCNAVEAVRYLLGEGASPDGSAKVIVIEHIFSFKKTRHKTGNL